MSSPSIVSELAALEGLERAKHVVQRLVVSGSPAHALLFYGPDGAGKTALARVLAKAWLCTGDDRPCGACASCLAFESGRNVDFQHVTPVPPSMVIRLGAIVPNTKPDQDHPNVVPLRQFLRTAPLMASAKVVLVDDADRMNGYAQNAVLKTLEEPRAGQRLLLTSSNPARLLRTIVSRCMAVACGLSEADLAPGLRRRWEPIAEPIARIRAIVEESEGAPRSAALRLSEEFQAATSTMHEILDGPARADSAEALRILAESLRSRPNPNPRALRAVARAHRRVVGNGHAAWVSDALFLDLVADEELGGPVRA